MQPSIVNVITLDEMALEAFAAEFSGQLIGRGDADYDQARAVWNGMIDRYPALIARCTSTEDVIAAVNFAHANDLPIAVRGGGHNVAGHATCDDGLVIDLSPMKHIEVDADAKIARVQGGVTWGELDAATQAYGLATPGGVFSRTGVAGLTLGGGFGWLRDKFGLSCDNLLAAEVVLASGQVVRASDVKNADLMWGLRGGGGNFGIVTTFEFQLHPLGPEVACVFAFHDVSDATQLKRGLQFFRDFVATAPDEISTIAAIGIIPPHEDLFPHHLIGRPFLLFGGVYAGPTEQGERLLQPLRDFSGGDGAMLDFSGIKPYVEVQQLFDADYPDGMRYYWKSLNLMSLDDRAIDRIVDHARRQPSPYSTTDLWPIGGAVKRSKLNGAFNGRQAAFLINPEANWDAPHEDEANIRWVREFITAMGEFSDGSRYLNFAGFQEEGDRLIRSAFGPHYARLAALKQKYDPTNLFRLNQNVKPTAQ